MECDRSDFVMRETDDCRVESADRAEYVGRWGFSMVMEARRSEDGKGARQGDRLGPDGTPLGIVHRDISPANLLVTFDGGVKLVDFGVAKARSRQTETRAGTLKGKIAYMSPEQCRGEEVDRRSDVFALGIILY